MKDTIKFEDVKLICSLYLNLIIEVNAVKEKEIVDKINNILKEINFSSKERRTLAKSLILQDITPKSEEVPLKPIINRLKENAFNIKM